MRRITCNQWCMAAQEMQLLCMQIIVLTIRLNVISFVLGQISVSFGFSLIPR